MARNEGFERKSRLGSFTREEKDARALETRFKRAILTRAYLVLRSSWFPSNNSDPSSANTWLNPNNISVYSILRQVIMDE